MIERRAYRITGRVQGVGFRWWTRKTAESLKLAGTVRNAPDGSVEVRAAGPPDALDRFEQRLREGPRGSGVDRVDRTKPGEDRFPTGFHIVR